MFNTLFQGAIPMRIGVAALPPTRAIRYHGHVMVVLVVFSVVAMVVPPPQERKPNP